MSGDQEARDYAHMMDLAINVLDHTDPGRPWPVVLDALVDRLDGCGAVLSHVRRPPVTAPAQVAAVEAIIPEGLRSLPLDHLLSRSAGDDPLIRHYLATGDLTPLATGDVVAFRRWRRTAGYAMARDLMGAHSCVSLPLAGCADGHRGITVTLSATRLTERERSYLRRVQPLLAAVDSHQRHLERWRRNASADDAALPGVRAGLTPRELTVLSLVAEAHTAAAIGRRLRISPRTVHKHLENLYRKLGTADRVSAIRHAQSIGLLPSRTPRRG